MVFTVRKLFVKKARLKTISQKLFGYFTSSDIYFLVTNIIQAAPSSLTYYIVLRLLNT